jgi:hypothetical protein
MARLPRARKTILLAGCLAMLAIATPGRAELKVEEVVPGVYFGDAPKTASDYRQLQCLARISHHPYCKRAASCGISCFAETNNATSKRTAQ